MERRYYPRGEPWFKGWRKPEGTHIVTRISRRGNPYRVSEFGRMRAIELYRQRLGNMTVPELVAYLAPLRGAVALYCSCKPGEHCHADVLIEMLGGGDGIVV